jgi:hypothetical protein
MDLVFRLGRVFGDGVSLRQFRCIFDRCALCHNLIYTGGRYSHRCNGTVLWTQADGFNIVSALLMQNEHAGLSLFNDQRLFTCCHACKRVCLEGSINLHECPVLDS